MADHSMTITNRINLFGGKVTYKWGTTAVDFLTFGVGKWGDGASLLTELTKVVANSVVVSNVILTKDVTKVLSDSISPFSTIIKEAEKFIVNSFIVTNVITQKDFTKVIDGTISPDSSYSKHTDKLLLNTCIVSGDLSSEKKYIGPWTYVFTSNADDAENRSFNTWATGTIQSDATTSATVGSTTWTNV